MHVCIELVLCIEHVLHVCVYRACGACVCVLSMYVCIEHVVHVCMCV